MQNAKPTAVSLCTRGQRRRQRVSCDLRCQTGAAVSRLEIVEGLSMGVSQFKTDTRTGWYPCFAAGTTWYTRTVSVRAPLCLKGGMWARASL
jgi:hypothetical protein